MKGPKIDLPNTNIDINLPNLNIPTLEGKIKGDINIPKIEPLNIRTILSGKIEDPIILNKNILNIPDITVGVKKLKDKKLDMNIPEIDIKEPEINIPTVDINVEKIKGDINILLKKILKFQK